MNCQSRSTRLRACWGYAGPAFQNASIGFRSAACSGNTRGLISILDGPGLEALLCGCYHIIRNEQEGVLACLMDTTSSPPGDADKWVLTQLGAVSGSEAHCPKRVPTAQMQRVSRLVIHRGVAARHRDDDLIVGGDLKPQICTAHGVSSRHRWFGERTSDGRHAHPAADLPVNVCYRHFPLAIVAPINALTSMMDTAKTTPRVYVSFASSLEIPRRPAVGSACGSSPSASAAMDGLLLLPMARSNNAKRIIDPPTATEVANRIRNAVLNSELKIVTTSAV